MKTKDIEYLVRSILRVTTSLAAYTIGHSATFEISELLSLKLLAQTLLNMLPFNGGLPS